MIDGVPLQVRRVGVVTVGRGWGSIHRPPHTHFYFKEAGLHPLPPPRQVAPERTFAVASLAGGAAESLVVRCLPSGLHVAHASLLLRQDHASGPRLVLDPDPGPAANTEGGHGVLSGQVDAQVLLRALRARGLPAAVAGERGAGRGGETGACAIEMEGARVLLRGDETTVFGSDFETVVLVNEAIREQLHSF